MTRAIAVSKRPAAKKSASTIRTATLPEMRDGAFILDGKATFLYSGELHYFRSDPKDWDERLSQARKAGLNCVASYIPWRWHESEEGKFDFTGRTHPRRNLREFIRLTRKHGLYFIPRVGPVSNGEMMNEGLPDWLSRKYPDAFLSGKKGQTIHHQSPPAYNNPKFLSKVKAWYEKLLPELTAHQYPQANIPLFQLCNEIGMINWLGKIGDYADYSERMYRDFLKARYGSIEKLNAAYGTGYKNLAQVRQPENTLKEGNLKVLLDWGEYYREYYAQYFAKIHSFARKLGVRTPVLANIPQFYDFDLRGRGIYSPATTAMFSRFADRVPETVFGGAYQMRRLDYENFHDIPLTSSVVKTITPKGSAAVCAELQTGILSDKPRIYPADVELNLKTSLMSGLDGVNGYMFAGGTNEGGLGQFGRYHEWQAPVASDGSLRPHYESLRRFGRFVNGLGKDVAGLPNAADVFLGHYPAYYNTLYLEGDRAQGMYGHRNEFYFDGLARLCYLAGYQVSALDLEKDSLGGIPALAVYSSRFMSKAVQEKLYEYARKGGRLLFMGDVLLTDEQERPCPAFLDRLGVKAAPASKVRTVELFGREAFIHQDIAVFSGLAAEDKVLAKHKGKPCGFARAVGEGSVCVFSFNFSDKFDYYKECLDLAWQELGVEKTVDTGNYDLIALLRKGKESGFLFLANYHDDAVSGNVKLSLNGQDSAQHGEQQAVEFPIRMERRTGLITPVLQPLPEGGRLVCSTTEVLRIEKTDRGLDLELNSGTEQEDLLVLEGLEVLSARCERGSLSIERGEEFIVLKLTHPKGETWNRVSLDVSPVRAEPLIQAEIEPGKAVRPAAPGIDVQAES
ncbi:MAG: beta-galactosidase [Elusimicrobiota bacterium]|jgi:beta-galactosidase